MFEKRIKEISKKFNNSSEKEFYILIHKKHRREIYFQNKKKALDFIKIKFNSPLKRIIYFLIKIRLLQNFLKKIKLPQELGDVIFVGGQIKGFDLEKKIVISFTKDSSDNKPFIKSKEFQKKVAKKDFAPEIFEINKKFPFSKEELLKEYDGRKDIEVFNRLQSYYKINRIKEITLKEYFEILSKKLNKSRIKNSFVKGFLKNILSDYPNDVKLKIVKLHGDFAKEQILLKNNNYIFTDWNNKRNIIIEDLVRFFGNEKDLLKNKHFNDILKTYPEDVKKNIKLYLLLNETYNIIRREKVSKLSKERIKNILGSKK